MVKSAVALYQNSMSLGELFVWKVSYLYQKVHTKPLFWPHAALLIPVITHIHSHCLHTHQNNTDISHYVYQLANLVNTLTQVNTCLPQV